MPLALRVGRLKSGGDMAIVVVRRNGTVIEMPDGAERFHAELRETGKTKAVDKHSGRTYHVESSEGDLHLTEHPHEPPASTDAQTPLLIRTPKLPMNK
jgi:hypothetical protein